MNTTPKRTRTRAARLVKHTKPGYGGLVLFSILLLLAMALIVPFDLMITPTPLGKALAQLRIVGTFPPTFDHLVPDFTINQTDHFFFDVNCSDVDPLDEITYSENFTDFEINSTTGIINKTGFNETVVGNNTIQLTCTDSFGLSVNLTFGLEILNVNEPPVLDPIGNQIATEGSAFSLQVTASDPDGDTLTFGENSGIIAINSATGFLNFTPLFSQIGNYTINFTVFDGVLYDHEVIILTIVRGPFCGDSTCSNAETCETCSQDCGSCPAPPPPPPPPPAPPPPPPPPPPPTQQFFFQCDERWDCSEWGVCSLDGLRTRKCIDINSCGTREEKPDELEDCVYQPTCTDGIQNGGETGVDCGGLCEPCLLETCFDGILNQDEEDIDCGGVCQACAIERPFTRIPTLEIPGIIELPRRFPWLLLLIIAILITATITYDQNYVHAIKKKKLEEYRELYRAYQPVRRRLYKVILNTLFITIISFFYIWYFSNSLHNMLLFIWIPLLLIIATPVGVTYLIRYYAYYEYLRRKKEERLKETHKRELLQLMRIENTMLIGLEATLKEKVYRDAQKHAFDEFPELYQAVNPLYADLGKLGTLREKREKSLRMPTKIVDRVLVLLENKILLDASKEYPEFMSIRHNLKYIEDNKELDTTDKEQSFMDDVEEISLPYMKIVIEHDAALSTLYNELVDLYDHYEAKHGKIDKVDDDLMDVERAFTDKVKAINKKVKLMDAIGQHPEFAHIYNRFVELFNHYSKKMQLKASIGKL